MKSIKRPEHLRVQPGIIACCWAVNFYKEKGEKKEREVVREQLVHYFSTYREPQGRMVEHVEFSIVAYIIEN